METIEETAVGELVRRLEVLPVRHEEGVTDGRGKGTSQLRFERREKIRVDRLIERFQQLREGPRESFAKSMEGVAKGREGGQGRLTDISSSYLWTRNNPLCRSSCRIVRIHARRATPTRSGR